jgi:peptidoglycan/LPS O-acetylase OafA/YrhL
VVRELAIAKVTDTARRNTNLDALRGVAILMVLGRHSACSAYSARVGWAGVDLFFVLSGFLISGLLFVGHQKRGRLDLSRFYVRRGMKIWPSFYVLIAAGVLMKLAHGRSISSGPLLAELFFVQSYFPGMWGITWSLAVEEHFYLLLPLLLLLIGRNRERPFAAIPWVFCLTAIFCLACRFAVGSSHGGFQAYLYPTHLRIDALMFGVFLSYYYRYQPATFKRVASWQGHWIVVAVTVLLLLTYPVQNRNMHTWGLTIVYLGAGVLVAKAILFESPGPMALTSRLLARIGVYSYSIYLWHIFFWHIFSQLHVIMVLRVTSRPIFLLCYFVGAITFGVMASTLIEMPMLRFRDRVFPSEAAESTGSN